jgi:L-lactate dehydrogenase complex protein LldG
MSSGREQILRDIRATLPVEAALPELVGDWVTYAEPVQQFFEVLRGVGGTGKLVRGAAALRDEIARIAGELNAAQICSVLPDLAAGNVDLAMIDDPHQLAGVDLAVLPGELAVAENAAVWITAAIVPERVLYFLSQHVVLVVPADRIVNNMHEAYAWLQEQAGASGPFQEAKWGAFMSGPSKTADIEQALVIGAHGARSLHVLLAAESHCIESANGGSRLSDQVHFVAEA